MNNCSQYELSQYEELQITQRTSAWKEWLTVVGVHQIYVVTEKYEKKLKEMMILMMI